MQAIQPWQMKTIYAIGRSLSIDGESLHALVEGITGETSIKALSAAKANAVIAELKQRQKLAGAAPSKKRGTKAQDARPGGVTAAQQGKIWALVGELEKWDKVPSKATYRERLCGVIKKEFGMDAVPSTPFAWLTMNQGCRLIDTLKRYVAAAERKALKEGQAQNAK